jgi:D-tyrosyl-tRNA(Tyr) deacylase
MRLVLQRVRRAEVRVKKETLASIGPGLLIFIGFGLGDDRNLPQTRAWSALGAKVLGLRVFPDSQGRFDRDLAGFGGQVLAVPQFTLYGDCRRGRRPSFSEAADPALAKGLFERFCSLLDTLQGGRVARGIFGADMDIELVNWGPVTLSLDSEQFA